MNSRNRGRSGSTMLDFTLVGIPLIFILISIFEVSRGMWVYHTLAHAATDTARYAAVHGQYCVDGSLTNIVKCPVPIATLAAYFRDAGVGLLPDQVQVTFTTGSRTVTCNPLQSCDTKTDCFPAAADCVSQDPDSFSGSPVTVTAVYPFASAISMFWPGGGKGIVFGTFNLPASATENILF